MKSKIKIQNQKSPLTPIFNQDGYLAQVSSDGTCVVHRVGELVNGQKMEAHCGEKLPSQDWREVQLYGCPHEIRVAIVQAWKEWNAGKS